jgi:hypothetical protein
MKVRSYLVLLVALFAATTRAAALIVPFTEDFSAGNANWLTGSSVGATWSATGGVDDGGYISSTATMTTTGFGAALFRGNAANDASADAFVGNWLSGGVSLFTAFIKHDATQALDIFARFDAGAGAAASSVFFNVPANQWFQMSIPIVNAPTSFQSYGAAGPAGFSTVFANIQNVQIFAATNSPAGTYGFSLDKVSSVPEPGILGMLGFGVALLVWHCARCRKTSSQRQ